MLLGKNTFPATDITVEQTYALDTMLTHPRPSTENTSYFLENLGRPLLQDNDMTLKIFMTAMAAETADRFEYDRNPGVQAFIIGAEFYASAFRSFSGLPKLPVQRSALERLAGCDRSDLISESYERLRDTAQRFCNLFERAIPTVPNYDTIGNCQPAMYIGAGMLHSVVMQSNEVSEEETVFMNGHPELAELADMLGDV